MRRKRQLLGAYDEVFAVAATGSVAVVCLVVVPVWGFGPSFLAPGGQGLDQIRGLSALFALTYGVGFVSMVVFLVLSVTLIFPDEWVDAD